MSKGQKRSNREKKKPKKAKPAPAPAGATLPKGLAKSDALGRGKKK